MLSDTDLEDTGHMCWSVQVDQSESHHSTRVITAEVNRLSPYQATQLCQPHGQGGHCMSYNIIKVNNRNGPGVRRRSDEIQCSTLSISLSLFLSRSWMYASQTVASSHAPHISLIMMYNKKRLPNLVRAYVLIDRVPSLFWCRIDLEHISRRLPWDPV